MTYDAVLVARRGLGVDEVRLVAPAFGAAIRWALFAEKMAEGLPELRAAINQPIPDSVAGNERIRLIGERKLMREELAKREAILYPPDDADG